MSEFIKRLARSIRDLLGFKTKHRGPVITTMRIIILYLILGVLWILLSDRLILLFTDDSIMLIQIQMVKGIIYVLVTAIIFYLIVYYRIKKLFDNINALNEAYRILDQNTVEFQKMDNQLYQLAYYSSETKLPNKLLFENKINEYINQNNPDHVMAMVVVGIDNFGDINEMKGHDVGDEMLFLTGQLLQDKVQEPNLAAHLGGDEFGLAFLYEPNLETLLKSIEDLFNTMRQTYVFGSDKFLITFSAGITIFPNHGNTFLTLYRNAFSAMATAKANGKDQMVLFDEHIMMLRTNTTELTNQLRQAIEEEKFSLHYQPIINLQEGSMVSLEALIRWEHPQKGNIPPMDFIPLAEKTGLIKGVAEWVFKAAFRQCNLWREEGMEDVRVAINISPRTLAHPSFIEDLKTLMISERASAKDYILEITESAVISDTLQSIKVLNQLRKMGFLIALDDFGTGYSSLTHLRQLPIDLVKIDRSFIEAITKTQEDREVLQFITLLAHHLNIKVVAEGVETIEQKNIIEQYKIDFAQGYFFSKPVSAEKIRHQP